ncbi:hypothetical protein Ssi02_51450 [Sinosporangium siamense]|uniref:Uncharacterized protein n=1 Tax=Sinosporangium siamense TaxID=1367973 RepID=A0A919RMV0_9ACTN|nr:hypothetical protein Ssi02_51450 [Sinosporangium siamense]
MSYITGYSGYPNGLPWATTSALWVVDLLLNVRRDVDQVGKGLIPVIREDVSPERGKWAQCPAMAVRVERRKEYPEWR